MWSSISYNIIEIRASNSPSDLPYFNGSLDRQSLLNHWPWLPESQVGHLTSTLGPSPLTNFQQTQCLSVLPTLIAVSLFQLQQIQPAQTQVTTARRPVRTHTSGPPSPSWCTPLTLSLIFFPSLFLYHILKHSHGHPDIPEVTQITRNVAPKLDVDNLRQETTETNRNPAFK